MGNDKKRKILELAGEKTILRPRDVRDAGLPRQYVYRLLEEGKLEKVGRGLYKLPDCEVSEHEMLLEVARRAPKITVCLLSALRFHGMTTQNPFQIWVAIHHKDRVPRLDVPLKITRMTGKSLTEGKEKHQINGVKVSIYNPAKTVADCFKFRNKIGLEVAIEALKDYHSQNRGTMSQLWEYAKINRVHNLIRPYAEAIS